MRGSSIDVDSILQTQSADHRTASKPVEELVAIAEMEDPESDIFVDPDLRLDHKKSPSQAVEEGEAGRDSPQGVGTFDVLAAVDKRGDRVRGFDVKQKLQQANISTFDPKPELAKEHMARKIGFKGKGDLGMQTGKEPTGCRDKLVIWRVGPNALRTPISALTLTPRPRPRPHPHPHPQAFSS